MHLAETGGQGEEFVVEPALGAAPAEVERAVGRAEVLFDVLPYPKYLLDRMGSCFEMSHVNVYEPSDDPASIQQKLSREAALHKVAARGGTA